MLRELGLIAGVLLGLYAVWRRNRIRARRRAVKREVRRFWEEEKPGELYPECPVCRMPHPESLPVCPFCERSRIRARALRRDADWALEVLYRRNA
jgi:hypothetical protein